MPLSSSPAVASRRRFLPVYSSTPSPPPSAVIFASLAANHPFKSHPRSSVLIVVAVAIAIAIVIAVATVGFFLHRRRLRGNRRLPPFDEAKLQGFYDGNTINSNRNSNPDRIPNLHRSPEKSLELSYLGTLGRQYAAGSVLAFDRSSTNGGDCNNYSNSKNKVSPEVRSSPPPKTQHGSRRSFKGNFEAMPMKDDNSEDFSSPKAAVNGRQSSIDFDSDPGLVAGTSSVLPDSIQVPATDNPLPSPTAEAGDSNVSDHIVESPGGNSCSIHRSTTAAVPTPPESSPPLTAGSYSPDRCSRRSEDSLASNSNVSAQGKESSERISSSIQEIIAIAPPPPENQGLKLLEYSPPFAACSSSTDRSSRSSQNSSARNSNASDDSVETIQATICNPSRESALRSSSPERYLTRSDKSSPRISDVSDWSSVSPPRINATITPKAHETQLEDPETAPPSPERIEEESFVKFTNGSDGSVDSPIRIRIPTPQPPPRVNINPGVSFSSSISAPSPWSGPPPRSHCASSLSTTAGVKMLVHKESPPVSPRISCSLRLSRPMALETRARISPKAFPSYEDSQTETAKAD